MNQIETEGDAPRREQPYEYYRSSRPHTGLCLACKKKDIDACVKELGIEPPFHWVSMLGGAAAFVKGDKERTLFHVASALSMCVEQTMVGRLFAGSITRELSIWCVPRDIAFAVRIAMRAEGLRKLISWLDYGSKVPENWHTVFHRADVFCDTREGKLSHRFDPW